jgi:DNA-binding response OmpR family regulator
MKKILIVDDEEDILTLLGNRLAKANYAVTKALNGVEAIKKAKAQKPDLIILDLMLPGIDGGEVEARLKEDEQTKNIPIVILSALYTKGDEKVKGNYSGGNVFVAKPYEPEKLFDIIRQTIGS